MSLKGVYSYKKKDQKKLSKKRRREQQREMLAKEDKRVKKMAKCTHIDCDKGKTHFTVSADGEYMICEICGGKILTNDSLFTKEMVESASEIIYSVYSNSRFVNNYDEQTLKGISNLLQFVLRTPEVNEANIEEAQAKAERKKNKKYKKKNKKDKFMHLSRIKY